MNKKKTPYEKVKLPNGESIKKWEESINYSKSYIVDQNHPKASDSNPGTEELPFASINKAARVVLPGEEVLVKDGVYREWVRPMFGGTDSSCVIKYSAFPGHTPIIRGSKQITEKWEKSEYESIESVRKAWKVILPMTFFQEWSPLMMTNLENSQYSGMGYAHFSWYYEKFRGKEPYSLKRALIFKDGSRLLQVGNPIMLTEVENSYYIEDSGKVIHISLKEGVVPDDSFIEVSHVPHCFSPSLPGLNYIHISGFIMEHAGNGFAYPMAGAISPNFGHHWIIENNIVRQCNGIGIDVGCQINQSNITYYPNGGGYLIRKNVIEECGFGGLEGSLVENTVVEDNTIHGCCWHDTELLYENGGIKFLYNRDLLIRNNLFYNIKKANAIWMDWACENFRVTGNIIFDIQSMFGGIFAEASRIANMIDNNIIWNIRGNGIYQHDCDNLIIAHNFIGNCTEYGVKMWLNEGRDVIGSSSECKNNSVFNNLCYKTNGSVFSINSENSSWNNFICTDLSVDHNIENDNDVALFPKTDDVNLYPVSDEEKENISEKPKIQGYLTDEAKAIQFKAIFDTSSLTIQLEGEIPRIQTHNTVDEDFFGETRGEVTLPGAFNHILKSTFKL